MPFAAPSSADPRPWSDIPGVALIGIALGLVLIWAAIRYILRKK